MDVRKVSVIIATYNTAEYIAECLDSIVEQTLQGIEIIIIDDGSTDNTQEVIKKYVDSCSNVFVYYQENMGAGLARNKGIGLAKGEYIVFMDPDDKYPVNDCLKIMYNTAKSHNAIICGGNILGNDNGKITEVYSAGDGTENNIKNSMVKSEDYFYLYGHTRYMFKSDFIKKEKIVFAPYKRYEDQVLTINAIGKAGEFYELDYPVYEYRINYKTDEYEKSIYLDIFRGFRDTIKLINSFDMKKMFEKNCAQFINQYMPQMCKFAYKEDSDFNQVLEEINDAIKSSGWSDEDEWITKKRVDQYIGYYWYMKSKFDDICKSNKKIIIYGAGNNTKKLLKNYKNDLNTIIGIAVTENDNIDKIEDIEVHPISDYLYIKDEALVLITPSLKLRDSIISVLNEFEFKQYEWVDVNNIVAMRDI